MDVLPPVMKTMGTGAAEVAVTAPLDGDDEEDDSAAAGPRLGPVVLICTQGSLRLGPRGRRLYEKKAHATTGAGRRHNPQRNTDDCESTTNLLKVYYAQKKHTARFCFPFFRNILFFAATRGASLVCGTSWFEGSRFFSRIHRPDQPALTNREKKSCVIFRFS